MRNRNQDKPIFKFAELIRQRKELMAGYEKRVAQIMQDSKAAVGMGDFFKQRRLKLAGQSTHEGPRSVETIKTKVIKFDTKF